MMNCREYIFRLTSGQLNQTGSGSIERFWAAQHRWICTRCRAFTRNDQQLDTILDDYRKHLAQPQSTPPFKTK